MTTRCSAKCLSGKRCRKSATTGEFCWTHGTKETIDCGICLEETIKKSKHNVQLDCEHIFCKECIFRWINTTPNCPKCRKNVSEWELLRAHMWGEVEGIVYRAQINVYPMNRLAIMDGLFLAMLMDIHHDTTYVDEEFKKIEELISTEPENKLLFQKLINKKYTVSLWIKTDTITGNPKILHTFAI
jgi:hypothetical protein